MPRSIPALAAACLLSACSAADSGAPVETGTVRWGRELEAALKQSASTGKPLFVLFQEVPGCAGCKQFGREVLSDPRLVGPIEADFVPLLIPNNQGGADAKVLKRFGEPAWNYQVVRFLDSRGRDLIPRKDRVWTTGPLAVRMIAALEKARRPVPPALRLLEAEHSGRLRDAAFSMHCFWTGEMKLGRIDGVVTTEAGFLDRREVTLVRYDPEAISLPELFAAAKKLDCARTLHLPAAELAKARAQGLEASDLAGYRRAPDSDQKKQLTGTGAARLDLSPGQATKVNAWIRSEPARAAAYLTTDQRRSLER